MKAAKKPAQAAMIRSLLAKKMSAEKIVERVKAACGGEPTVGYVNWLAKKAKTAKLRRPARRIDGSVDGYVS